MNPEPPPIADPHSTHSLPPETAPRTFGTVILGLVHLLLGLVMFALGIGLPVYFLSLMTRLNNKPNAVGVAFVLFIIVAPCGIGWVLVRHGLRIWKHGC